MAATIIDGVHVAGTILAETQERAAEFEQEAG